MTISFTSLRGIVRGPDLVERRTRSLPTESDERSPSFFCCRESWHINLHKVSMLRESDTEIKSDGHDALQSYITNHQKSSQKQGVDSAVRTSFACFDRIEVYI